MIRENNIQVFKIHARRTCIIIIIIIRGIIIPFSYFVCLINLLTINDKFKFKFYCILIVNFIYILIVIFMLLSSKFNYSTILF